MSQKVGHTLRMGRSTMMWIDSRKFTHFIVCVGRAALPVARQPIKFIYYLCNSYDTDME